MTDEELAEMVRRVWAEVPEDGTEPDPATKTLLCVLFREWGGRDADEAFAVYAALQDERGGGGENSAALRRSTEALVFAIWAGYGEQDPAGVWEVLDGEVSTMPERARAFLRNGSTEAVATLDRIVRKLLEQSPEKVLEAAEGNHPFRSVAVRAWLASVDDPTERVELFKRWVGEFEAELDRLPKIISETPHKRLVRLFEVVRMAASVVPVSFPMRNPARSLSLSRRWRVARMASLTADSMPSICCSLESPTIWCSATAAAASAA
jgi:hypothetical protein